jgi:hypothetical protein
MEENLKFVLKENDLHFFEKGRRPQFFLMEDDIKTNNVTN